MADGNRRLGEYVLERRLGAGAFGEVHLAHHHVWTDRLVAIKIPTDPAYLRQLQAEGWVINRLRHPGIVQAIGFDPYADPPYLVMEYVPGTCLRPLIRERNLGVDQALSILRQVLVALDYAHRQGVVHRDLKPENILIDSRALQDGFGVPGVVKLTDFGLGHASASAGSIVYSASLVGDEARAIVGTLDYMAPEQRFGESVDGRADLYACGVILYEMLTGVRPVGMELPSELNPAMPTYFDDIFRRAYARLERRYSSAGEFFDALPQDAIPAAVNRTASPLTLDYATPALSGLATEAGMRLDSSPAAPEPVQPEAIPASDAPDMVMPPTVAEERLPLYRRIQDDAKACLRAMQRGNVTTGYLDRVAATRVNEWQAGAELGWPEGQWLMGLLHERGLCVRWDLEKAARLYRKAGVQGYARAMTNLAYLYMIGRGVPRNPRVALRWYGKAAELGNAEAQRRLVSLGLSAGRGATD